MNTLDSAAKQRFFELVPWYVTGQIGDADRAWVDEIASTHPEASAQLAWHRQLHDALQAKYAAVPEDVGLERLMARVREDAGRAPVAPRVAARPGWGARLEDFLRNFAGKPALAFSLAVIVAQAGVIGVLLNRASHEEASLVRGGGAVQGVSGPLLRVTFKAETTERDLRLLLVAVGARVVDGPGQLGGFVLAVPAGSLEAARQQLAASGMVESVEVLADKPASE